MLGFSDSHPPPRKFLSRTRRMILSLSFLFYEGRYVGRHVSLRHRFFPFFARFSLSLSLSLSFSLARSLAQRDEGRRNAWPEITDLRETKSVKRETFLDGRRIWRRKRENFSQKLISPRAKTEKLERLKKCWRRILVRACTNECNERANGRASERASGRTGRRERW